MKNKIDAYLLGKLSEAEAKSFEEEIAADPYLAEQLKWQRLERQVMATLVEKDIRQEIGKWDAELEQQNQTKGKYLFPQKQLVRFIIIIIVGFLLWKGVFTFVLKKPPAKEIPIKQEVPITTLPESEREHSQKESVQELIDSKIKKADIPSTKSSSTHQLIALDAYGEGLSFVNLRSIDEDESSGAAIIKEAITAYQRTQWNKAIQMITSVTKEKGCDVKCMMAFH